MKIRLKDIVEKTGVSKSVISMYLNKDPRVRLSDAKKILIDKTVEELGYKPSMMACALSKGYSKMLGIVLGGITDPYFARMAEAVLHYAEKRGYQLLIQLTRWNMEKEHRALESLLERQVDGIIYAPHINFSDAFAEKIEKSKIPFLHFRDDYDRFLNLPRRWEEAFHKAADFLQHKKRKNVVLCVSPESEYIPVFKKTFASSALKYQICNIAEENALKKLVDQKPDAIIAGNNEANQFIQLSKKKYKRKTDVISFCNFDVDSMDDPWISGVLFVHFYEMMRQNVECLIDEIEKKNIPEKQQTSTIDFFTAEDFRKIRKELPDTLDKAEKQQ